MSGKPIFMATHPRACSTAFERVFMTRRETLNCIHEPFGEAFYFGPERLSVRYEDDPQAREESGHSQTTYGTIFDEIERKASEGKRLFIKDIIHYVVPPSGKPPMIAPSLQRVKHGVGTDGKSSAESNVSSQAGGNGSKALYPFATEAEPDNPTVIPAKMLAQFHFTFLIRDPHRSVPSYYRCTIPPLAEVTGFHEYYPSEAGYDEVRRVFDYLRKLGLVGPRQMRSVAEIGKNEPNKLQPGEVEICVLDADQLLDEPAVVIEAYCNSVGIEYDPGMLTWDSEEQHNSARKAFEKWKGFHDDAINSKDLKPRTHKKKERSEAEWDKEWDEKYGAEAARMIRETVDKNMDDYNYMKQFVLKV